MASGTKTIAELLVKIGVDSKDAEDATKKLGSKFDALKSKTAVLSGGLKKAGKAFAIFGAAASAAAFGVFKFVDSVTKAGDDIGKEAKKIGAGTTELQRLRFAADRSGASAKSMSLAIKNSAKQLEDAKNGGAKLFRDALTEIGVELEEVQGLTAEERLVLFADRLADVGDEGKKTALAMNLFGARAGPELLPLLKEGGAGIRALGDEAEALGLVMDEEGVAASERFQDRLTDLQAVLTGVKNEIGVALIPVVEDAINKIRDWVQQNKKFIAQKLPSVVEKITKAFKSFLDVALKAADGVGFIFENFDKLFALFVGAKVAQGFLAISTGFKAMGIAASGALGPIGLIAGALIALIPIAIEVGNKIGAALAGESGLVETNKRSKGPGFLSELGPDAGKAAELNKAIRDDQRFLEGRKFSFSQKKQAERRIAANRGKLNKLKAAATARNREREDQRKFEVEQDRLRATDPDFIEGPSLEGAPEALVKSIEKAEKKRLRGAFNKGRGAGKSKTRTPITSPTSVSEFFKAAAAGDLGPIAARTPSVKDIEPTVAVDITNNNFKFEISQDIKGQTDPARIGQEAAAAIKKEFEVRLSAAGQQLATSLVR
jgi:hypothetical protein